MDPVIMRGVPHFPGIEENQGSQAERQKQGRLSKAEQSTGGNQAPQFSVDLPQLALPGQSAFVLSTLELWNALGVPSAQIGLEQPVLNIPVVEGTVADLYRQQLVESGLMWLLANPTVRRLWRCYEYGRGHRHPRKPNPGRRRRRRGYVGPPSFWHYLGARGGLDEES